MLFGQSIGPSTKVLSKQHTHTRTCVRARTRAHAHAHEKNQQQYKTFLFTIITVHLNRIHVFGNHG